MLKGRNLGAAYVILLAVAINALAVTLWLALNLPVSPGLGLSHDSAAGTEGIEALGYFIVWLAFFAIVGFLTAARILLHEVGARSPASVDRPKMERRTTQARDGA